MNILFAFADDWGRYASAYAGHDGPNSINSLVSTPNFDRIAREGALFRNAFVPAPTCTPCRSAILSGSYFWQTGLGAILIGAVWDDTIPTYPLELEKAGYHIGFTYKVWSPGKSYDAPYGGLRTAYMGAGRNFGRFSHYVTERAKEVGVEPAKNELYDEVRKNFDAFLDARPPDKPFCYWWGPTNTHRTWEQGSGKALWGLEPDSLQGKMPAFLPDVPDVREDFCDYLGECQAYDAGLGVLLDRLEEIGELDNTLIVVSGDHGIPGIPRGKCNLYNIGCEVALAARWPGRIKAGRVVDDFINLMDLAPTFLEAAGVAIPDTMTAKSLMPLLMNPDSGQADPSRTYVITGRERHVHTAREGGLPYPQRSIRTEDYLYIINFEPDRWPMGDPIGVDHPGAEQRDSAGAGSSGNGWDAEGEKRPGDEQYMSVGVDHPGAEFPSYEKLQWDTHTAYSDLDASPTKAWMVYHRYDREIRPLFELGFGKRPYEELYDLRNDPDYMRNVAGDPGFADIKRGLRDALMNVLIEQKDPRVTERPCRFEHAPYAGDLQDFQI